MSFEVGDEVYSLTYREGTVANYHTDSDDPYIIRVQFNSGVTETYTKQGKLFGDDDISDLYHGVPVICGPPEPKRRPNLKMDDKVLVRRNGEPRWYAAHFKKWKDNGQIVCWAQGVTSFTAACQFASESVWQEYKLPED